MSRRDTIILAVLINSALLSILFFTATRPETAQTPTVVTTQRPSTSLVPQVSPASGFVTQRSQNEERQESQQGSFAAYHEDEAQAARSQNNVDDHFSFSAVAAPHEEPAQQAQRQEPYVEVLVKRGDFLQKIARSNGTTTEEIKRINNLTSDRIDIGQVLLVPARKSEASAKPSQVAQTPVKADVDVSGAEYYVLKPNDNLWNISRQIHVKFDDLLHLNNLDEDKARTLRPGDKIRVR